MMRTGSFPSNAWFAASNPKAANRSCSRLHHTNALLTLNGPRSSAFTGDAWRQAPLGPLAVAPLDANCHDEGVPCPPPGVAIGPRGNESERDCPGAGAHVAVKASVLISARRSTRGVAWPAVTTAWKRRPFVNTMRTTHVRLAVACGCGNTSRCKSMGPAQP